MPRTTKPRSRARKKLRSEAFGPAAEEFGDEIRPLGREIGALTVRTVRALLKPVGAMVWAFEKVEEWISTTVTPKLEKVPEEERIEPKLVIAGPTIEAMKYYGTEPDLADMFANLLVASMDRRTAAAAHPAFIEIIKQISTEEARILRLLNHRYSISYPVMYALRCFYPTQYKSNQLLVASEFGPYSLLARYSGCKNLELTPTYLINLVRLSLIDITRGGEVSSELLEQLLDDPLIVGMKRQIENEENHFRHSVGQLTLTPLGNKFLELCVGEGVHNYSFLKPK